MNNNQVYMCVSGYSEAEGALWESEASVGFHGNCGPMQWSGSLEIQYMLYASPSVRAHIPHTLYLSHCTRNGLTCPFSIINIVKTCLMPH